MSTTDQTAPNTQGADRVDPLLRTLRLWADGRWTDHGDMLTIDAWRDRFGDDPMDALRWSSGMIKAVTRRHVARQILRVYGKRGDTSNMRQGIAAEAIRQASYLPSGQSDAICAHLDVLETAVWADLARDFPYRETDL